jgi:hypothetical protein
VADGRHLRRPRPGGLLRGPDDPSPGPGRGQPDTTKCVPGGDSRSHGRRNPGPQGRHHARLHQVEPGVAARRRLVPAREAASARGASGCARDRNQQRLVVGMADAKHQTSRSGQGSRGVRVALDAQPAAVQRPGGRRPGLQHEPDARADNASARRPVRDRRPTDHVRQRPAALPRHT